MFPLCLGPARNSTILVIFSPPIFPLENSVRLASRGFPFSNHRNTGRGLDSPAKQRQTKNYINTVHCYGISMVGKWETSRCQSYRVFQQKNGGWKNNKYYRVVSPSKAQWKHLSVSVCLGPARNSTILVIFSPPIFPRENSVRLPSRGFPFSNHRNTGRGLDLILLQNKDRQNIT